jgi:hypothetical protein
MKVELIPEKEKMSICNRCNTFNAIFIGQVFFCCKCARIIKWVWL